MTENWTADCSSISSRNCDFSQHHYVQNGPGTQLASYPTDTEISLSRIKWVERDADHSHLYGTEVKYAWNLYFQIHLQGVVLRHKDSFTFNLMH
jgi:hypothetical protein